MCFYTIKVISLHTWFNFSISSNTQKEDLGGTQVGNDHVSRTRIKKISITFLRIIPINYLSWKVREPNYDWSRKLGSMLDLKQVLLTVTILKEKFLNLH